MNNFQNLHDHEENKFNKNRQKVANDVWKTLGVFKFVGQIVDAYVPKLVDLFVVMSGGQTGEPDPHNLKEPSSDPNNRGPRDPGQWT